MDVGRGFGLSAAVGHRPRAAQIGFRMLLAMVSLAALASSFAYAQSATQHNATRDAARQYVEDGLAAQKRGDYDTAITLYTKAYETIPHPVLLFDIAQAHRLAGHIKQADAFYNRFLATNPTGPEAQIARDLLAEMNARHAQPPPAEQPHSPDPPSPSATALQVADGSRQSTPWYKDKIVDVLVFGGVAATTVAAIVYGSARSDANASKAAADYDSVISLSDKARDKRLISVAFAVGGASLVVAGVVRYVLHDRVADPGGVDVAPTGEGAMITYGARF